MNKCEKCGFLHYRTDPCRKPKKSTAARKDVQTKAKGGSFVHKGEAQSDSNSVAQSGERLPDGRRSVVRAHPTAGTQALPVDTNSQHAKNEIAPISQTMPSTTFSGTVGDKDRKPKFDKKAWMREYMREYMRKRRAK